MRCCAGYVCCSTDPTQEKYARPCRPPGIRLPPAIRMSYILQIRNNLSALKDLDHELGIRDLSDVWNVFTNNFYLYEVISMNITTVSRGSSPNYILKPYKLPCLHLCWTPTTYPGMILSWFGDWGSFNGTGASAFFAWPHCTLLRTCTACADFRCARTLAETNAAGRFWRYWAPCTGRWSRATPETSYRTPGSREGKHPSGVRASIPTDRDHDHYDDVDVDDDRIDRWLWWVVWWWCWRGYYDFWTSFRRVSTPVLLMMNMMVALTGLLL